VKEAPPQKEEPPMKQPQLLEFDMKSDGSASRKLLYSVKQLIYLYQVMKPIWPKRSKAYNKSKIENI